MCETTTAAIIARDDEAGFRAGVPREVNGFTILAVSGWKPGGVDVYPAAIAVWERDEEFGTHMIVHADNAPPASQWYLTNGHYGMTRAEADADARERTFR